MKNIINKIPKLRFPEFEGVWEEKKLGDLLSFKNGINATKEQYGRGYKFINVLDIINNDYITHDCIIGRVEISKKEVEKNEVIFGDVLFQRSSETREEVGQANVYLDNKKNATFGGFVIRGRKISQYYPQFLNLLLKTQFARKEITTKSGGSTRYNVGQGTLEKVSIISTNIEEQKKIASFLTTVDKRINQLTKKKELLERYKKGVMQKIFSQKIRFKDDDGDDFPEWEETKLGKVTKLFSRRNKQLINAQVYSVTNTAGFVPQTEVFQREIAGDDLCNYKIIKKNEFAYNPARINVGSVAYFKNEVGIISSLYVCFSTTNELEDYFLLFMFQLDLMKHNIIRYGEGGVRVYLWYPLFASIKIMLPTINEQEKIASFLSSIDKKIEQVKTQIKKSNAFKKGLLQQMFV